MALKTSLRLIARAISRAVETAAQAEGLTRADYTLFGSFDEGSDRIHLLFVTPTAKPFDGLRLYARTFEEIRRAFPHDPQIGLYIGMVVRKVHSEDEVYRDSVSSVDDVDITSLLELP
jgi:hypothetical protein